MEGKIDAEGSLYIKRGRKLKSMECPWDFPHGCGDHCPHFGEPNRNDEGVILVRLTCGTFAKLFFNAFTDDRGA